MEVQFRTHKMHYIAEYGFAAHWKYKEKLSNEDEWLDKVRVVDAWSVGQWCVSSCRSSEDEWLDKVRGAVLRGGSNAYPPSSRMGCWRRPTLRTPLGGKHARMPSPWLCACPQQQPARPLNACSRLPPLPAQEVQYKKWLTTYKLGLHDHKVRPLGAPPQDTALRSLGMHLLGGSPGSGAAGDGQGACSMEAARASLERAGAGGSEEEWRGVDPFLRHDRFRLRAPAKATVDVVVQTQVGGGAGAVL